MELLGAGQPNPSCGSIADLQDRLRNLFSDHVKETRVGHISVTFELRATAIFEVPVTETENEALENASNIDPLLGGTQPSAASAVANGGQSTRRVNAIDALINQPLDDPVLQTSITRHIINGLNEVDGSNWTVHQVSRAQQGWTFTYICNDSWQSWSRQSSKTRAKVLIGEWSEKGGQDPAHMARPAFDCRGSVKVAFVKSARTINVEYEHMPMHKTVAQLIELLAPPPVAPLVKTLAKTLKEPKPPKEPKPKTLRKRTGEDGIADGEGSQPKRRRKKKDSVGPSGPEGSVLPPEMPGALPVGPASPRQFYNTQVESTGGPHPHGSSNYPEGLVNTDPEVAAAIYDDVHSHSILNLPPGEAARRRALAIKLLTEKRIDPKTLSAEQFSIFANQSSELQQDSLAMLVEYGARRLRIVHPNKDGANSGQATPDRHSTPALAVPAVGIPEPKEPGKKTSDVGQAPQSAEATGKKQETSSQCICDSCRVAHFRGKCDEKKPLCSSYLLEGHQCVYSPAKLRQSRVRPEVQDAPGQSAAIEIPEEIPEDLDSPGVHTVAVGEPVHEPVHAPAHEHFYRHVNETVNEPISDLVPHQIASPSSTVTQSHSIYQHFSGLTFPQVGETPTSELPQSSMPSAPIEYVSHPAPEAPEDPLHDYTYPTEANRANPEYAEQAAAAAEQVQRGNSPSHPASRHSLLTSQPSHLTTTTGAAMNAQNSWQSTSGQPTAAASATGSSPRQSRTKKPAPASQAYDDLRQCTSSWATVNQSTPQTTQPVRASPSEATAPPARAKPRQSRIQSHTPVNGMAAVQPDQSQESQSLTESSGYESAAAAQPSISADGYNSYDQYPSAANAQPDSFSDRIPYQPYADNQASAYSSFDNYNTSLANPVSSTISTPASQVVISSYPSTSVAAPSTIQWGAAASTSQAEDSCVYNAAQAAAGTSSYNTPSNPQQPQPQQGFNVRHQPSAQAKGSSSMHPQQQQQRQPPNQSRQTPKTQQHRQQQSYSGHMTQQQQQQQPPHTVTASTSHQGWCAFAANNTASSGGYSSNAAAAGSISRGHGHGHATSHNTARVHANGGGSHGSMDLASHTYSSMGGDEQVMYDLLRSSNPVG
ncbi:hypothetical protein MMYC01_203679 [Madurella mycetomatis]|uniref:Uncharacterized protein n=1 Tax=Madurella mycetomatis TaxID=100816 RepID=A0A175W658_9PEZI|nr:hypothetical protein MMYC01_203679 [Madurella mycetomatis]